MTDSSRRRSCRARAALLAPLAPLLAVVLSGCHYYQVRDPKTGETYYADRWIAADGYTGPLSFTDSTGRRVELRSSQVTRLSKDDYLDASAEQARRAEQKPQP